MSLGSSSFKCVGAEWVREDSYREGVVLRDIFMLVFLVIGWYVCMQVSCVPGLVMRGCTLEYSFPSLTQKAPL